ncbi:hypothetical protein CC85DRAFT_305378 [Cutaneotrichosporon oleaginosum]|uniref:Uncharacterized protein n=1 Tax=Cutaneotrichosporon oleaginosum TaxID=879819 RepID=A0A0J0XDC0_9TREE|nr:uncharacterized protein CC85DRAFT_305378 [Cutaneotrichosporon oleaginosum]KLT39085.1 hypothetical protein CC85DRAFT_305378 [Cutaneotrichosporon oleaginosum]TXT08507.1 hypothetical protein COLE_05431 [Cutaneotrichosporon oleaginosum]
MVDHPFSGTPRGPSPRTPTMPPHDALRALLHAFLHVTLRDGRILSGNLLAVDASASLLLYDVHETRTLPKTDVGANVAQYYPWSRPRPEEGSHDPSDGDGGFVRRRELASVLVNMRDVAAVEMGEEDAASWSRFACVAFEKGQAVPPTAPSPVKV